MVPFSRQEEGVQTRSRWSGTFSPLTSPNRLAFSLPGALGWNPDPTSGKETLDLDNLKGILQVDPSSRGDLLMGFDLQVSWGVELGRTVTRDLAKDKLRNLLVIGMGGSAIGGDLLRSYLSSHLKMPLFVNRNYELPIFAGPGTLAFVVSYSGNTEETQCAFQSALKAGCTVVLVTSGGRLATEFIRYNLPLILVPPGLPPRAALGYLFFPQLGLLEEAGLVPSQQEAIQETEGLLSRLSQAYGPQSLVSDNLAKQLALKLLGKVPLICGVQDHSEAVALRWKGQLNENSKAFAVCNLFPEINHNEIVDWEASGGFLDEMAFIFLRDRDDLPRISKRMEITIELVEQHRARVIQVFSEGESWLARLFSLIYLGDFVSYYLALLKGVDPTPVVSVDYLKRELARETE